MPVFTFSGKSAAGEKVSGERVAANKDVLIQQLRRERITPPGMEALTRLRLRPTRYIGRTEPRIMGITGRFQWTPIEPAGTCPGYGSLTLDGSEDPWTTGACDDNSTIRGGRVA
jgi:hypothetical protein